MADSSSIQSSGRGWVRACPPGSPRDCTSLVSRRISRSIARRHGRRYRSTSKDSASSTSNAAPWICSPGDWRGVQIFSAETRWLTLRPRRHPRCTGARRDAKGAFGLTLPSRHRQRVEKGARRDGALGPAPRPLSARLAPSAQLPPNWRLVSKRQLQSKPGQGLRCVSAAGRQNGIRGFLPLFGRSMLTHSASANHFTRRLRLRVFLAGRSCSS